jgi:hypothetical protein
LGHLVWQIERPVKTAFPSPLICLFSFVSSKNASYLGVKERKICGLFLENKEEKTDYERRNASRKTGRKTIEILPH